MKLVVTTESGQVQGVERRARGVESFAFLGVPYAEPPVGPLRFAAPQPRARWAGVRDATRPGPTPQRRPFADVTTIPEPSVPGDDILNVSVFTPDPGGAGMPVLVWFHGGGYVAGSPASPWYDGAAFNRDGVVTVNVAYRLGHQGFGAVPGAVANRAVLDWLAALRWVQDNIAAFGGDPSQVTIAGQSAGGGAVLHLLALPAAQGLFRSAVSLSGATHTVTAEEAAARAEQVARAAGVSCDLAGFMSLTEEQLIDAQGVQDSPATPLAGFRRMLTEDAVPGPVVDGELIAQGPIDSFAAGVGAEVPLMMGATDDEFTLAAGALGPELDGLGPLGTLEALGLDSDGARRYLDANSEVAADGMTALAGRLLTDTIFRSVVPQVAALRPPEKTWAYRWAVPSTRSGLAEHCHDLPFVFDCLDAPGVEAFAGATPDLALVEELHGTAVRFVTEGDAGWAPWGVERSARMLDTRPRDVPGAFDTSELAAGLRLH